MLISRRGLIAAVLPAVLLLSIAPALAQAPRPAAPSGGVGRIAGHVVEIGKDPVAYANVVVLGTKQGTMTDEKGNFVIVGVPVGTQEVKVQQVGFEPLVRTVDVNAGATSNLEFNFGAKKVVKQIEEIEVRAEKRIDTKSSTTKQSISSEKLRELPVDNLMQAVAVKAGVVAASDG